MPLPRFATALVSTILIAGCTSQSTSIHKDLSPQSDRLLPRRILLAQPDTRVHEISAGELVEEVAEWSKTASDHAAQSVEVLAQSTHLTVVENEPADIAGHQGFRVQVRYKNNRGLEIQRVAYGFADKSAYYDLWFGAPMLYYFDTYYPDFQKAVASFQLGSAPKTANVQ